MNTKHTPGPWEIRRDTICDPCLITDEDGVIICENWGDGNRELEQFDADARLIAAAPDLLEACADLVQLWQDWAKDSQSLAQPLKRSIEMRVEDVRAAIAKAEGRE